MKLILWLLISVGGRFRRPGVAEIVIADLFVGYEPQRPECKQRYLIREELKHLASACSIERKLTFHKARRNFGTYITLSMDVPMGYDLFQFSMELSLMRQKIGKLYLCRILSE